MIFFVLLLTLCMASSEKESYEDIVASGLENGNICIPYAMLTIYAPIHTIVWCITNSDKGWKACGEELLVMLTIYGTSVLACALGS